MKHKVIFDEHARSVYEAQNELRFRLLRLYEAKNELRFAFPRLYEAKNELRFWLSRLYEAQNELRFRLSRLYEAQNELRFRLSRLYEAQNELRFRLSRLYEAQNELRFRLLRLCEAQNELRFCFIQSSGRQKWILILLHTGMKIGKRNVDRPSPRWSEPKADLRLAFPLFAWHPIGVFTSYRLWMAVGRYLIYRRARTYDN